MVMVALSSWENSGFTIVVHITLFYIGVTNASSLVNTFRWHHGLRFFISDKKIKFQSSKYMEQKTNFCHHSVTASSSDFTYILTVYFTHNCEVLCFVYYFFVALIIESRA